MNQFLCAFIFWHTLSKSIIIGTTTTVVVDMCDTESKCWSRDAIKLYVPVCWITFLFQKQLESLQQHKLALDIYTKATLPVVAVNI